MRDEQITDKIHQQSLSPFSIGIILPIHATPKFHLGCPYTWEEIKELPFSILGGVEASTAVADGWVSRASDLL